MSTKPRIWLINPFNENVKTSVKNINEKETVWFVNIIPVKEAQTLWQPDDPTGVAKGSPLQSRVWPRGAVRAGGSPPRPFSHCPAACVGPQRALLSPLVKCDELSRFHISKVSRGLCSKHVPGKQIIAACR